MTSLTLSPANAGSISCNSQTDINDSVDAKNVTGFCIIFAIFTGGLVTNVVVASKIVVLGSFVLPASVFIWALTYPCSDIVAEAYGRKYANKMVLGGFVAYALALLTISGAVAMPAAPFWEKQEAFESVLGSSLRVAIAALTSYGITQFLDVYVFSFIRRKTGSKHLWIRNNLSTLISQTMANTIFLTLAFWGTMEFQNWLDLFTNNLMARYALAFSDTAIVYAGVYTLYRIYPELKRK
ncbi:MAG: queuosine precursor transporter [Pseudomonadota bacterium]